MGFDVDQFVALRPFAFHLTSRENVERIRQTRVLTCATELFAAAGARRLNDFRRAESCRIQIDGTDVLIRDQAPLRAANVRLPEDWTFEHLIRDLNGRVFFWPGGGQGPSRYGRAHFERYRPEGPVVLRLRSEKLLEFNRPAQPLFCKYNSGAPRCHPVTGKSPRGPDTFVPCQRADFTAGDAQELTFLRQVALPPSAEYGSDLMSWAPLWPQY